MGSGKTIAYQDIPCDDTWNSPCCLPGFACLSNKLCASSPPVFPDGLVGSSYYLRGSCADPSWKDPSCLSFCKNVSNGDLLSCSQVVVRCDEHESIYACMDSQVPGNVCYSGNNFTLEGHMISCRNFFFTHIF